jgi:hypothetical protein
MACPPHPTFIGTVSPTLPFNAAPVTWKWAELMAVNGHIDNVHGPLASCP